MRYFIKENNLKFYKEPAEFNKYTPKETLQYAVGANLYMPATQHDIFRKLSNGAFGDLGSITLCMEDAISDEQLPEAEKDVQKLLSRIYDDGHKDRLPLVYIRVRNTEQFMSFSSVLSDEQLSTVCGFCFPKFNSANGREYFRILDELIRRSGATLYAMPIIEDRKAMYKESRFQELSDIRCILEENYSRVLNVRVGGTDFSSIYGLRRQLDTTIYDIKVVADCLKDILNFFLRDENNFVVSGPVWEYYSWNENSPEIKGLKHELSLDIQNGFHGKTIIHPSQIEAVNKAYIVDYDEYQDAVNILHSHGGVFAGVNGNRMNETNPHRSWATKVMAKAEIFGVVEKNVII